MAFYLVYAYCFIMIFGIVLLKLSCLCTGKILTVFIRMPISLNTAFHMSVSPRQNVLPIEKLVWLQGLAGFFTWYARIYLHGINNAQRY